MPTKIIIHGTNVSIDDDHQGLPNDFLRNPIPNKIVLILYLEHDESLSYYKEKYARTIIDVELLCPDGKQFFAKAMDNSYAAHAHPKKNDGLFYDLNTSDILLFKSSLFNGQFDDIIELQPEFNGIIYAEKFPSHIRMGLWIDDVFFGETACADFDFIDVSFDVTIEDFNTFENELHGSIPKELIELAKENLASS